MLAVRLCSLANYSTRFLIRRSNWKSTFKSTFIRHFSSGDESGRTVNDFIQIPTENNDLTFEIYDNSYENYWEEDPEFDYAEITPGRPFYPFVTDQGIQDIVCIELGENPLAAYMVIGSGNTNHQIRSAATLIHKIMKHKHKQHGLNTPRFEGLNGSCEWIAINLGDILLHLFLRSTRDYYDLESLWSAGSQFDEKVKLPTIMKQSQMKTISWDCLIQEIDAEKKMSINKSLNIPNQLTS